MHHIQSLPGGANVKRMVYFSHSPLYMAPRPGERKPPLETGQLQAVLGGGGCAVCPRCQRAGNVSRVGAATQCGAGSMETTATLWNLCSEQVLLGWYLFLLHTERKSNTRTSWRGGARVNPSAAR